MPDTRQPLLALVRRPPEPHSSATPYSLRPTDGLPSPPVSCQPVKRTPRASGWGVDPGPFEERRAVPVLARSLGPRTSRPAHQSWISYRRVAGVLGQGGFLAPSDLSKRARRMACCHRGGALSPPCVVTMQIAPDAWETGKGGKGGGGASGVECEADCPTLAGRVWWLVVGRVTVLPVT